MDVVKEGLAKLQEHPVGIAFLSVVGPYHSGKSFLLNSLLKDMRAFIVGRMTTAETMGIWLCRTSLKGADGSEVWLMDSEGFFGPGIEESYDAKVFTVASLLGSHLVYNTVKIIDQQAVNLLEVLMTQAQLFNARSTVRATVAVPEFLKKESFPPLTWVVEDFVQELPAAFKQEGPFGYLTTYLQGSSEGGGSNLGFRGNETHETIITKTFRDVKVAHLFLPATTRAQLQDLSRLEWSELTQEYRSEVDALRDHVLGNVKARQLGGQAATGPALAQALRFTVQALQQGMFHELPSLWTSWKLEVAAMSLTDADEWFAALLQDVDRGENPIQVATFNGLVEDAREQATKFYRNLIHDFNVKPQMGELRNRMERHFDRKLQTYHERTRRWVTELITTARDNFGKILASFVLPMDPTILDKEAKNSTESLMQTFNAEIKAFSAPGKRVTFGGAATMAAFTQTPATQLANDFRAQLTARAMENEREVDRVFKAASSASDEAIDAELRTNGELLLSKARLNQLKKNAEVACWRAFDDRLGTLRWAVNLPKYQTQKAQVQKEHLEARIGRFSAAHEKRLNVHLHTGLQSSMDYYNQRGATMSMPSPTEDLEAQHAQLSAATQDRFKEYSGTLVDTNAFTEASKNLARHMAEGLRRLEEKNVELWKVYSDGATRCAAAANNQRALECGSFPPCLFNNNPWWHRSVSRRNLNDCFQKDPASARMSPKLQAQVFEVWYTKDLGQASNYVASKFMAWCVAIVVLALGSWWWRYGQIYWYQCCMRRRGYPVQYQMSSPGMFAGNGYNIRQDACYGQQQPLYGQQAPQYGQYGVTQRRGFFGA
jgi:hypothetical protein